MPPTLTPPFERTTCGCATCVSCCKQQPGYLIPGDIERIAGHMRIPVEEAAMKFFRQSPGAQVMDRRTGQVMRFGSIVPAPDSTGRCVFLSPDDQCLIHPVAPFGCAMFDPHMGPIKTHQRQLWGIQQLMAAMRDPFASYYRIRSRLAKAASYRPFA